MIRNLLAAIGFLCVAMAGTAAVYATRWYGSGYGSGEDVRRLAVGTSGLDLTSREGQRLLDLRVDAAIDRVCANSGDGFGYARSSNRDCRRDARAGADPQIARAIDRAFDRIDDRRRFADDDMPIAPETYDPTPIAPEPAYEDRSPPPVQSIQTLPPRDDAARVLREKHTTITRTPLKPRVKWVRTKHGLVKKVIHRKLVRKTVKVVYTR